MILINIAIVFGAAGAYWKWGGKGRIIGALVGALGGAGALFLATWLPSLFVGA